MASKGQKFNKYSSNLKEEIINGLSDGKSYTELSRKYDVPAKTISTWQQTPKMHFSSPKSKFKKEMRSHHDYIYSDEFIKFLGCLKSLGNDIDIMIEAKKKDEAMFRLIRELKYKTEIKFLDDTSFVL